VIRIFYASCVFFCVHTLAACETVDTECHTACQKSNSCSAETGTLQCDSTCATIDQKANATGCGGEVEAWLDCVSQNACNAANQHACAASLTALSQCVDTFCLSHAKLDTCANR
jgi:hypothetical protein